MHATRSLVLLTALLSCLSPRAQEATARTIDVSYGVATILHEQPDAAGADFTLWVCYPTARAAWLDHRQYLEDLGVRFRDRGVAVGVLLPAEHAKAVAAAQPKLVVAGVDADQPNGRRLAIADGAAFVTRGCDGDELYRGHVDGIVDVVALVREPQSLQATAEAEMQLASLIANVADGGDYGAQAKQCLQQLPHSGRAHAGKVLFHWWCEGDLDAARQAIDAGINALADDAMPLATFADLVLRGDRNDPANARKLAMAMAPVAAGAPDGVFTQLVYLRALLHAGQDRLAGRVAATLQKKVTGTQNLLIFAETLMDSATPAAFRDLALRAIDKAEPSGAYLRWSYGARHKVLARCGEHDAAQRLMAEYRKSELSNQGLNNDAWYMIVQPETMGRFDPFAGAQADEMMRVEGDGIDYGSKDTVALAWFVNGKVAQAAELQDAAAKASGNDAVYLGRLQRYQNTLAELRARADESGK